MQKKKLILILSMFILSFSAVFSFVTSVEGTSVGPVYTIGFDSNSEETIESQDILVNQLVEIPSKPNKKQAVFEGWYTDKEFTKLYDFEMPVTASFTLYAKWIEPTPMFTIQFNSNGGTVIASQVIGMNELVKQPTGHTKEIAHFEGWYTDKELTKAYDFEQPVSESFTLYAKWIEPEIQPTPRFTIEFNSNGGSVIAPQDIFINQLVKEPLDPIKDPDYPARNKFIGWYTDKELTKLYDFATPVSASFTLYAKWIDAIIEPTPMYTIEFNSNGGSAIASQDILITQLVKKPNNPTKNNASFDGWYLDKELTQLYDFDKPVNQAFTLYAKWTEDKNTVATSSTSTKKPLPQTGETESLLLTSIGALILFGSGAFGFKIQSIKIDNVI